MQRIRRYGGFNGIGEYETLRLIDLLGYTQDECAGQMGVARTTVQAVYNCARKKLADMLVNGKRLVIEGGNYELCGIAQSCCGRGAGAAGEGAVRQTTIL